MKFFFGMCVQQKSKFSVRKIDWTVYNEKICSQVKKSPDLHIVSNSSIFVDNCSLNVRVLPNTNWDAAFCSQKHPVSIRLEQEQRVKINCPKKSMSKTWYSKEELPK